MKKIQCMGEYMNIVTGGSDKNFIERVCGDEVSHDERFILLNSLIEKTIEVTAKVFHPDNYVKEAKELDENTPKQIKYYLYLLKKHIEGKSIDEQGTTILLSLFDSIDIFLNNHNPHTNLKKISMIDASININDDKYNYYSNILPEAKFAFLLMTFVCRMMQFCSFEIKEFVTDLETPRTLI